MRARELSEIRESQSRWRSLAPASSSPEDSSAFSLLSPALLHTQFTAEDDLHFVEDLDRILEDRADEISICYAVGGSPRTNKNYHPYAFFRAERVDLEAGARAAEAAGMHRSEGSTEEEHRSGMVLEGAGAGGAGAVRKAEGAEEDHSAAEVASGMTPWSAPTFSSSLGSTLEAFTPLEEGSEDRDQQTDAIASVDGSGAPPRNLLDGGRAVSATIVSGKEHPNVFSISDEEVRAAFHLKSAMFGVSEKSGSRTTQNEGIPENKERGGPRASSHFVYVDNGRFFRDYHELLIHKVSESLQIDPRLRMLEKMEERGNVDLSSATTTTSNRGGSSSATLPAGVLSTTVSGEQILSTTTAPEEPDFDSYRALAHDPGAGDSINQFIDHQHSQLQLPSAALRETAGAASAIQADEDVSPGDGSETVQPGGVGERRLEETIPAHRRARALAAATSVIPNIDKRNRTEKFGGISFVKKTQDKL